MRIQAIAVGFLYLALSTHASSALAAPSDCLAVADSLFPQDLINESIDSGADVPLKEVACVSRVVGASGKTYVFALYSNGGSADLRVIRLDKSGPITVAESTPYLSGLSPRIRLVDVDTDGVPEIVATLAGPHMIYSSIFRWKDDVLLDISPEPAPDTQGVSPDPTTFDFVDIDGDGTLELLASNSLTKSTDVYQLGANGAFGATGVSSLFDRPFVRGRFGPEVEVESFKSEGSTGTMIVVNGIAVLDKPVAPVDSATVKINGARVCGPNEFRKKSAVLRIPLHGLGASNVIAVSLAGQPGSGISVLVLPASQVQR